MKSHRFILFLIALSTVFLYSCKKENKDDDRQSLAHFIATYGRYTCNISRDVFPPATTVRLAFLPQGIVTPDYPCRIIFLDTGTGGSIEERDCYYVFYDVDTGNWKYITSPGWIPAGYVGQPDDFEFMQIIPDEFIRDAQSNYRHIKRPGRTSYSYSSSGVTNDSTIVIIVNTGRTAYYNRPRFNQDCQKVFNLAKYHYCINPDNIYVLMGDGTSTDYDCFDTKSGTFSNTNTDLDDDGIPDIRFAATKADLMGVLSGVKNNVPAGYNLFFYITGPTTKGSSEVLFQMWGDTPLFADELEPMLTEIANKARIHCLIQSDYGGYFATVSPIITHNGTITTAGTNTQAFEQTTEGNRFTDLWCASQWSLTPLSVYASFSAVSASSTATPQYVSLPATLGAHWSPDGKEIIVSDPSISGVSEMRNGYEYSFSLADVSDEMNVSWSVGPGLSIVSSSKTVLNVRADISGPYLLNSYVRASVSGFEALTTYVNIWTSGTMVTSDFLVLSGTPTNGTISIPSGYQYDTDYQWSLDGNYSIILQTPYYIDYLKNEDESQESSVTAAVSFSTPFSETLRIVQEFCF